MQIGSRTTGGVVQIRVTSGGKDYPSPPTVNINGGGGTGASAVAVMSGTRVDSVFVTNQGTGYTGSPTISFSHATGTGAAATAFAYTGPLKPISFFKGRFQDVYGVDGMGRGFRWNGEDATVEKIGVAKPAIGPSVTTVSGTTNGYIASVQMVQGGAGYFAPPTVTLTGGSATTAAQLRARVSNGRVTAIDIVERGSGYKNTPTINISGGIGSGAAFGVAVSGRVQSVSVQASGSGYTTVQETASRVATAFTAGTDSGTFTMATAAAATDYSRVVIDGVTSNILSWSNVTTFVAAATTAASTAALTLHRTRGPVVVFSTSQGLTQANASVSVDASGSITAVNVLNGGTGATTSGVTASISSPFGSGAQLSVSMAYAVASVTVATSGSGYYTAPVITFRANSADTRGTGAAATAFVNTTGNITGASVISGGEYSHPPTAIILNTEARAQATVFQPMRGTYKCAIRYLDDTPDTLNGPIPSSISELVEVEAGDASSGLTWSFAHYGLDDRVTAMELWRTTASQSTLLFRVATIQRSDPAFTGTYSDTLTDADLADGARDGYLVMPVTLPNGQINARRFEVPPPNYSVACMFQDRAWYAVDTTGEKPNTLYFSEIDEPESVPLSNELVVQENSLEPDIVVGLVPMGGMLLIAQRAHLYSLQYVSQPIIDASVLLVAHRGMLNSRCGCVMESVAMLADSAGIYAFDGQSEEAISVPIDNYWRDGIIDMSKADQFHMRADVKTKTVRFFYCQSTDSAPTRALCYCTATKAWWEETYPTAVTATCSSIIGNRLTAVRCTAGGALQRDGGTSDNGTAIPYRMRTGNAALTNDETSRSIALVYQPTTQSATLSASLYYNNSSTPRPNAISSDRGDGFVTAGGTHASLNMSKTRSALGDANGFAQAYFSGRVDDRSSGGDRHIAVELSGEQSADEIALYAMRLRGAE